MGSLKIVKGKGNRLVAQLKKVEPQSKDLTSALFKIGNLVRNAAVQNVTDVGAVDTGNLRSSIKFEVLKSNNVQTVVVGAFGVKYARMVEFGGIFTDLQRRAMFASLRDRGRLGIGPPGGKGIISGGQYQARPYLGPAVRDNEKKIRDILAGVPRGD